MDNFKKHIDNLVSKVLSEEIENKVRQITESMSGEWTEIEVDEELKGNQKKLDVAKPKGKLTAADFKKLGKSKEAQVGKKYGGRHGMEEQNDTEMTEDYDNFALEMVFLGGLAPFMRYFGSKLGDFIVQSSLSRHDRRAFKQLFNDIESNPDNFKLSYEKSEGQIDMLIESNSGIELDHYKNIELPISFSINDNGGVEVTYVSTDGEEKEMSFNMGETAYNRVEQLIEKFGEDMSKQETEEQETEEGNAFSGALSKAKKDGKDSFEVDGKEYSVKESKGSLKLTEDELIEMIERIVMEQKVKDADEKENITKKSPQGLKTTEKVLSQNKKENDEYTKEVVKKMKEYMKDMSKEEYNENPEDFPRSNYQIDKDAKIMKYNPSEAVDEYIDAFSHPGMTNLVYDEIKPDDEKIDKYLQGDSTTGNAVTDKDGKALGNVSKSDLGKKFKKNYDENLYGAEQMNGSYKRVPQPVDVAGDKKQAGSLAKSSKILNKLESTENKKDKIVSEEMNKMKNLIGYNRKTQ